MKKKKRVLVAMSGGVDSSVSAALLLDQGYDVVGATMQVWDYSKMRRKQGKGTCCSSLDVEDARNVSNQLKIPFYVINCESEFQTEVIDPFLESYSKGKTPIPCIQCNTHLKFDHLLLKMRELECDYLATGHYAKIVYKKKEGSKKTKPIIKVSSDDYKDQTYFLFTLQSHILPSLLFPVGHWNKTKVRDYAKKRGLSVALKKDSTGLCFIDRKEGYSHFIKKHILKKNKNSDFSGLLRKYPTGQILGSHQGIYGFTYGQRKGLGISSSMPLYVIDIESNTKTVWLGEEKYLYESETYVENPNFLDEFHSGEKLHIKIRFSHKGSLAKIKKEGNYLHLKFDEPQRAITPGQAAVFYRNKELVGGGWIFKKKISLNSSPLNEFKRMN